MNDQNSTNDPAKNPDPITGEPGSHPVGTGVGAGSAGLAGAAIGTAVGGPVGGAIGLVAGAVAGAYGGRGVAEAVNPTQEEAYWRENHTSQPFATTGDYEQFQPGYRTGYQGFAKHAGRNYDDVETDLAKDYEQETGGTGLPWDQARHATRAAWARLQESPGEQNTTRGVRSGM